MTLETKGFIVVVCAIVFVVLLNGARRYKNPQYREASSGAPARNRFWSVFAMVACVGVAGLVIAAPSDQELRRRREAIWEEMRRMQEAAPTSSDIIQERINQAVPHPDRSVGSQTPPRPTQTRATP